MKINYSDEPVIINQKSIFLAGPTPRSDKINSWRDEACKKLEELGFDGVVYEPEFSTGLPKESYIDQAEWERKALTEATIILFWIPRSLPDKPGFTTNVEFGYWLHTKKVIYGRPEGAVKTKYLDWLYEKDYQEKPLDNLDDLLKLAITRANQKYSNIEPNEREGQK